MTGSHSGQAVRPTCVLPAMKAPTPTIDVFLRPGELYFGDRAARIRTILGSCVSITMWHPRLLLGGMCHFMLPKRGTNGVGPLDGRYADEAVHLLMKEIRAAGTSPTEYQVKLFGGGDMFAYERSGRIRTDCGGVASRNRAVAHRLLTQYGLSVAAEQLGGPFHRQVLFEIWSGDVWVRQRSVVEFARAADDPGGRDQAVPSKQGKMSLRRWMHGEAIGETPDATSGRRALA